MDRRNYKKLNKAQVSMEYLMITGIILLALIPVFYYAVSATTQTIKINQASEAVTKIRETADTLYIFGSGSQDTIKINLPGGVKNITFSGKDINLKLEIFKKVSDISEKSKGNITGSINNKRGIQYITLKNANNVIQISG